MAECYGLKDIGNLQQRSVAVAIAYWKRRVQVRERAEDGDCPRGKIEKVDRKRRWMLTIVAGESEEMMKV